MFNLILTSIIMLVIANGGISFFFLAFLFSFLVGGGDHIFSMFRGNRIITTFICIVIYLFILVCDRYMQSSKLIYLQLKHGFQKINVLKRRFAAPTL